MLRMLSLVCTNAYNVCSMYDLERFTLKDMTLCGAVLRKLGQGCNSLEELAQRTVEHLFLNLGYGGKTNKACALVQFYVTLPYGELGVELQRVVHSETDITIITETPCLTMLGSIGTKTEWCRREANKTYEVLALPDPVLVESCPVVAQLVARFDLPGAFSVPYDPDVFLEEPGRSYDVLYIPDANAEPGILGEQHEFMTANGIKSIVGFGGLLPTRNLFAIIVYSKVPIALQTARAFRPFALNTKIALLPFDDEHPIFSSQAAVNGRR